MAEEKRVSGTTTGEPGPEPDAFTPTDFAYAAGIDEASDLAERVSVYLLGHGWYRDGDDPGIWIRNGHGSMALTDALAVQLVADGVKWPTL